MLKRSSSAVTKNQVLDIDELELCRTILEKPKRSNSECRTLDPILGKLDFFFAKPQATRLRAIKLCSLVSLKSGDYVFSKGDVADKVYVIISGVCTVILEKSRARKGATVQTTGNKTISVEDEQQHLNKPNKDEPETHEVPHNDTPHEPSKVEPEIEGEAESKTTVENRNPIACSDESNDVTQNVPDRDSTSRRPSRASVGDVEEKVDRDCVGHGESKDASFENSTETSSTSLNSTEKLARPSRLSVETKDGNAALPPSPTERRSPKSKRNASRTRGSVMLMRSPSVKKLINGEPIGTGIDVRSNRTSVASSTICEENAGEEEEADENEEGQGKEFESNVEKVELFPGKSFGEFSVLGSSNEIAVRSATVEVSRDCDLLVFPSSVFSKLVDSNLKQQTLLKVETLQKSDIFAGYTETQLYSLSYSFDLISYCDGEIICNQGDQAVNTFMVAEGSCQVLRKVQRPALDSMRVYGIRKQVQLVDYVPVTCIGPGDIFGTSALDKGLEYKFLLKSCSSIVQMLVIKASVFRNQLHRWVRGRMIRDDDIRMALRDNRAAFVDQFSGRIMEARQLAQVVQTDKKLLSSPASPYALPSERYPTLASNTFFQPKSPSAKLRAEAGVGGGGLFVERVCRQSSSIASADTVSLITSPAFRSPTVPLQRTKRVARALQGAQRSSGRRENSRSARRSRGASGLRVDTAVSNAQARPHSAPPGSRGGELEVQMVVEQVRRIESMRRNSQFLQEKYGTPRGGTSARKSTKRPSTATTCDTVQHQKDVAVGDSHEPGLSVGDGGDRNLKDSMLGNLKHQVHGLMSLDPQNNCLEYPDQRDSVVLPTKQLGYLIPMDDQVSHNQDSTQYRPSVLSDMQPYFTERLAAPPMLPASSSYRLSAMSSAHGLSKKNAHRRRSTSGLTDSVTGFQFESERELMEFAVRVLQPNQRKTSDPRRYANLRNNLPIARDSVTSHVDLLLGSGTKNRRKRSSGPARRRGIGR